MKDQEIVNDISQYLQDRGALAISKKQKAGALVIACYRGIYLALQIRKPGKRMTNKQLEFSRQVGRAGGIHVVAHKVADARSALKTMDAWMMHIHDNGARPTKENKQSRA
jgi:hypothetical protein